MNSRVVMAEQSSHVNISLHSKLGDEEEEEQATMVKQSGDEGALVKADGGDEGGAGGGDDDDDDEDEEDLVDPMDTLRDSCKAQVCSNFAYMFVMSIDHVMQTMLEKYLLW